MPMIETYLIHRMRGYTLFDMVTALFKGAGGLLIDSVKWLDNEKNIVNI